MHLSNILQQSGLEMCILWFCYYLIWLQSDNERSFVTKLNSSICSTRAWSEDIVSFINKTVSEIIHRYFIVEHNINTSWKCNVFIIFFFLLKDFYAHLSHLKKTRFKWLGGNFFLKSIEVISLWLHPLSQKLYWMPGVISGWTPSVTISVQCAPMTWDTACLRPVQPDWIVKGRACKQCSMVRAPERPLGI